MESLASEIQPDYNKRWNHIRKILERSGGPFCHHNFSASNETLEFLMTSCKILVIGKQIIFYFIHSILYCYYLFL